jgi:hypothetical protein
MTSEIVNRLRKNSECLAPSIMLEAADTIERLRAERDDARQEACCLLSSTCDLEAAIPVGTIVHSTGPSPEHFARIRGWDCFQDIAIDSEDGAP